MTKARQSIHLGLIVLFGGLLILASPASSQATIITFNDFSSGFDVNIDTGRQTKNGVTFQYSDDQVIDLRTAASSYLDIINSPLQFGTFTLDFLNVPTGHYL
jgi:hypothetical protein